jgi:DNA-binding transcriptional LysR family regulator
LRWGQIAVKFIKMQFRINEIDIPETPWRLQDPGAGLSFSLKQVRYFIAAAQSGQFSQAAVELNVTQSAITAAIRQLEDGLSTRLFERQATGVVLTTEGTRFLQHARNIMAAVEEAARSPRSSSATITGEVRVGVTYTVAGYFMPSHHARFVRSHPAIRIELYEASRSAIEQALIDGALDIAVILTSNLADHEKLDFETLMSSRRRLWLPDGHALSQVEKITLGDVAEQPYVMLTVDEASRTASRYWSRSPFRPNVTFRTSSVEAVRSMVAAGMGVTILSDMVYRPWSLEGQRIEARILADDIPTMDVGMIWRRGAVFSEASRAFFDYLGRAYNGAGHPLA